ncbi:hypothetical protein MTO96_032799, partial [Rhipicephalus appendiculatus]
DPAMAKHKRWTFQEESNSVQDPPATSGVKKRQVAATSTEDDKAPAKVSVSRTELGGKHLDVTSTQCGVCEKVFNCRWRLRAHLLIHAGEKPYACNVCDRKYARKDGLVIHNRTHTGERPYECRSCPAAFTSSGTLKRHMMSHTGERPHQCDACGKRFASKSKLLRHTRTHSGKKMFDCDVCGRKFSTSSAPVISPALPAVPVWVSHTQVPDDLPSAHYSVTPSYSTSLVFDPWKRFHYSDLQKKVPKKRVVPREELRENTARSSGTPASTPSALLVRQRKALVLALAIVACIVAFLVTARRLRIRDQDASGGIERLVGHVTNVTTLQHHIPSSSSGEGVSVDRGRIGAPAEGAERRAYGAREKPRETTHRSVASGPPSISESTPNGDFSSYSAHPDPDT